MTPTEIAAVAVPHAIRLWNRMPEERRVQAIAEFGTKENAVAELGLAMVRNVAARLTQQPDHV